MIDEEKIKKFVITGLKNPKACFSPIFFEGNDFYHSNHMPYIDRWKLYSKLNIDFKTEDKLIECGCNTGTNLFILADLYPKLTMYGCDILSESIEIANYLLKKHHEYKRNYNISFDVFDMYNVDYSKFNFVLYANIDFDEKQLYFNLNNCFENGFKGTAIIELATLHNGIFFDDDFINKRRDAILKQYDSYIINCPGIKNELLIIKNIIPKSNASIV